MVRERSIVKIETGRKNGKKVGRRREGKRRNDFDGEEKAEWEYLRGTDIWKRHAFCVECASRR